MDQFIRTLRDQLAQKNLEIEHSRVNHARRIDQLEEKVGDLTLLVSAKETENKSLKGKVEEQKKGIDICLQRIDQLEIKLAREQIKGSDQSGTLNVRQEDGPTPIPSSQLAGVSKDAQS